MIYDVVSTDRASRLQKAFATNADATSFSSKTESLTKPSGDGVHRVAQGAAYSPALIQAKFYIVGEDNDAANFQLWGWSQDPGGIWVPELIFDVAAIASATTGIADGLATASGRYCDTLTLTHGNSTDVKLTSPENEFIASLVAPLYGAQYLEFEADMSTGDPTSANALWRFV